jgi:predicted dehydrogenase
VRIGIIGAGNFSPKVLEHLMAIDTLTVVGGYDSLVLDGFQSYSSLEEMLPEVDTVLVFDILYSSFASLSMVIKYGKNLYIESPGLCTNRELRNLEMLGYESGSVVQIGQKQRYYSFYDDLTKYDITPRIMESSRFVKFNKKSTQLSVIDDLMLHDIDVTLMIANAEVKSIYSTAVGVYYKDPDVVNTRIEFYNGCVANLSASKISNKEVHQTKFFQNNTYCSIDYIEQLLKVQSNTGIDDEGCEEWGVKTTYRQAKDSDGYISMVEKEINSFYHCIMNDVEPISGISQYLQLQSVTDKIKEQLERNFTTNA